MRRLALIFVISIFVLTATGHAVTWVTQTAPAAGGLRGVNFVDSSTGFAVGHSSIAFRTLNG